MIKEFVAAWDQNKTKLEQYIRTHRQIEYRNYETLVEMLLNIVINPYFDEKLGMMTWDSTKITIVDDGDYQGTQLFIIPKDTYQPSASDYIWTYQYYGSCSGCDALMAISEYDDGLPTEEQIKEYMALELHLLQRLKYMISNEEEDE